CLLWSATWRPPSVDNTRSERWETGGVSVIGTGGVGLAGSIAKTWPSDVVAIRAPSNAPKAAGASASPSSGVAGSSPGPALADAFPSSETVPSATRLYTLPLLVDR